MLLKGNGLAGIISIKNLTKRYNNVTAVDNISLEIEQGSCFGLIGPNGAGKTTIIEVIEDIIEQDAGDIFYKGKLRDKTFNQQIGIQFQKTNLLSFLSVKETLKIFASFYDNPLPVDEVIKLCMLEKIENNLNNKISGGQLQRLSLGLALLNDPELMFLDEPTTGLDLQARKHIWQIIRDRKQKGKTIVITTHYMEEAQNLCDTIAIMDQGRIIEQGLCENLIDKHCKDTNKPKNLETVFLKLTGKSLRD